MDKQKKTTLIIYSLLLLHISKNAAHLHFVPVKLMMATMMKMTAEINECNC